MQLRVARLCLDCEELHVGDVCPVCASAQYAFLAQWLPVEERRRWRRPASASAPASVWARGRAMLWRVAAHVLGDDVPKRRPGPPRTRAADHVPDLTFDERPRAATPPRPVVEPHPLKNDGR